MIGVETRASLAQAIASDRGLGETAAGLAADAYLAWKAKLDGRGVKPWEEQKARRYVDRMWLWEGRPSVIFAGQGKGKSNFATWAIEKVLETRPDWEVYTNIPFAWDADCGGSPEAKPSDRLHPIASLSEVLRGAAVSVQAGRKPAVVIDEMDQAVTSHNWMSEDARSWQLLLNIERHLKIRGPLLVYHAYRHVPVVLREGTMLKSMLQVIVKDGKHWVVCREEEGFLCVPPTVLPYLTYGLRGFDIDVDVQDLERHLSGSGAAVVAQVRAYLDRQQVRSDEMAKQEAEAEQARKDLSEVRAFVFRRLDEQATVRELSTETGLPKSTIGRIRLAWAAERTRRPHARV